MEYKYNGYTFIPHRQLKQGERGLDLWHTMKKLGMRRDDLLGMWNYSDRKVDYDYTEFYEAMNDSSMDIFYCKETKKYYIPCENELFECNG